MLPAVIAPFTYVEPFPIKIVPLAGVVLIPVPPFPTAKSVPLQLLLFIVPKATFTVVPLMDILSPNVINFHSEPLALSSHPNILSASGSDNSDICDKLSVKVKVKSNGSPSEPVDVSVQLISIPVLSTNFTSLFSVMATSVPSPSSITKPLPIVFVSVEAIVTEPEPAVTVMLEPSVIAPLTYIEPLPINIVPLAGVVVAPVPPVATPTVPVLTVAPSIVTTPPLLLAIVVSVACPNSIVLN